LLDQLLCHRQDEAAVLGIEVHPLRDMTGDHVGFAGLARRRDHGAVAGVNQASNRTDGGELIVAKGAGHGATPRYA
jgi:hypothetical protein